MKKKAIGYVRVSTADQAEHGSSLAGQEEAIRVAVKKGEYELIKIYSDAGLSGSSKERPAFQDMMRDAHLHRFDVIFFTKFDRLSRSLIDLMSTFEELKALRIDIIATNEPGIDTTSPQGFLIFTILGAIAEFERSLIGSRTKEGRMRKWKQNSIMGALPLGYIQDPETKEIIVDVEQEAIYRRIVKMYLQDRMNIKDIALTLTREGVKTPTQLRCEKNPKATKFTTRWEISSIGNILKSPAYTGEVIYNKTKKEFRTGGRTGRYMANTKKMKSPNEFVIKKFPPLITKEMHEQILQRLADNRKRPAHEKKGLKRLLGPYVYCGLDGSKMNVFASTKKGKESLKYRCYWESTDDKNRELKQRQKCTMPPVPAEHIDKRVMDYVSGILENPKKYAQDWLSNLNMKEIEERIAALEQKQILLNNQLKSGFNHIMTIQDEQIRQSYINQQRPIEQEIVSISHELTKAHDELDAAMDKSGRLLELRKAFDENITFQLNFRSSIREYLENLPFDIKRSLIEAVICPEKGGRVEIDFTRAGDIVDDADDPMKPLPDEPMAVTVTAEIDPERIGNIIKSLSKKELYESVNLD